MTEHDVVGQMKAAGLDTPPLPLDLSGCVRRFGPKKRQWYRLVKMRTAAGSYVVVGSFGDWRHQESHRVDVDWAGLRDDERQTLEARRKAQAEAEAHARALLANAARMTAAELWAAAKRHGTSPYLQRKAVDAEVCRYLHDGSIVVPLLRYDLPREQALRGVQTIKPDGAKRFTKGFDKSGACLRLGHVVVGEPILVCEGYATGLTLRMALDRRLPVVVGLDCGNLPHVVEQLRSLHPHAPILICADDDWRTEGNPGRMKAHKLARSVHDCAYTWPVFRPGCRGDKDTDFNDLHVRDGLAAVRRQLRHVLPLLGCEALEHAA